VALFCAVAVDLGLDLEQRRDPLQRLLAIAEPVLASTSNSFPAALRPAGNLDQRCLAARVGLAEAIEAGIAAACRKPRQPASSARACSPCGRTSRGGRRPVARGRPRAVRPEPAPTIGRSWSCRARDPAPAPACRPHEGRHRHGCDG
jgi:hypothetical protein